MKKAIRALATVITCNVTRPRRTACPFALVVHHVRQKMKAVALLLFVAGAAWALPSKQAEADSVDAAHRELERLTGLTTQKQYDQFVCEVWFYESVDDSANFAGLKDEEKKALRKLVGDRAFFLHRFTPKKTSSPLFEVVEAEAPRVQPAANANDPARRTACRRVLGIARHRGLISVESSSWRRLRAILVESSQ